MNKLECKHVIELVREMGRIIIANEKEFCDLDSVAGDGDFGMSLAKGFRALNDEWDDLNKEGIGPFLVDVSMVIAENCGGASGPIWGSAFRGAGRQVLDQEDLSVKTCGLMLDAAVKAIQKRGKAQLGDKTLLDALIPTAQVFMTVEDTDFLRVFQEGALAARQGAEATKKMVASKGRASYVGDRSLEHPDAGAMALGIIFTGLADHMKEIQ